MKRALVAAAVVLAACSGGGNGAAVAPTEPPPTTSALATTTTVVATTVGSTATTATTATAPAAPSAVDPCGRRGPPPARYDHVVWIWMENHTSSDVLGSGSAPYERDVASRCGSANQYRSVGSPSLPNYLGATSGDTHGVHDDGAPAVHPVAGENLFRQVVTAGGTAKSYEESMPVNCDLSSSGRYAVKHNPQAYFAASGDRAACARDDVPLGALGGGPFVDDLAAGRLPTFSFVTPNLCDDTHDCPVSSGDGWLRDWLSAVLSSTTYAAGRTVVFVVWDEPTPMPLLVIAPDTPAGVASTAPFDHYSLLRTTEELLGLNPFLGQAAAATSMGSAFGL